ncbi:MAG TPA: MiaB/RimO family radical SAM methylthiotransferase [Candidatus Absconditabacterales bacterium]|nr:MiaB/RimO family radical SAM methylthiotransferase [Candidatus Absconditabacterales bacterium]
MKTFHILTFGCQMNYADTARIKTILLNCGFSYKSKQEDADIIILVTCSVRQKAEDKITGLLKDIKKNQKIWITGCMIQHNIRNNKLTNKKLPQNLKIGNFGGIINRDNYEILGSTTSEINKKKITEDFNKITEDGSASIKNKNRANLLKLNKSSVIPINNAFNPQFYNLQKTFDNLELFRRVDDTGFLPKILEKIGYDISYEDEVLNEYEKIIPKNENTSMNINHKKTAYVPISTGCNQFCSYCIVPYARGLERNFKVEEIIKECKEHLQNGAEELILLGQIVNKHPKFVEIVKEVLKLNGLRRLRYTSPYPTYYSDELLKLHETEDKLCPHIHIPFQSGSDKILKSMNRGYNSKQAFEFVNKIKNLKRDISITTDIIVGFPDETEEDFEETLKLIEHGKFDMIYIGIYSTRPGTYADKNLKDNISPKIKQQRREKLNELLNKISKENNENEVGNNRLVLINSELGILNSEFTYQGYTDNMKQIIINSDKKMKEGDFVNTKIIKGAVFKLYGKIL